MDQQAEFGYFYQCGNCKLGTDTVEACGVVMEGSIELWQLCGRCAEHWHTVHDKLNQSDSSDDDMPPLEPCTPEELSPEYRAELERENRLLEHYKVMEERGCPGLLETFSRCSHGPVYMLHDGTLLAACGRC